MPAARVPRSASFRFATPRMSRVPRCAPLRLQRVLNRPPRDGVPRTRGARDTGLHELGTPFLDVTAIPGCSGREAGNLETGSRAPCLPRPPGAFPPTRYRSRGSRILSNPATWRAYSTYADPRDRRERPPRWSSPPDTGSAPRAGPQAYAKTYAFAFFMKSGDAAAQRHIPKRTRAREPAFARPRLDRHEPRRQVSTRAS